jgi:hypothetical protein
MNYKRFENCLPFMGRQFFLDNVFFLNSFIASTCKFAMVASGNKERVPYFTLQPQKKIIESRTR